MFQDAHIHVQDIRNPSQVAGFLADISSGDFGRLFNCAITPSDWSTVLNLARQYSYLVPAVGIHPWFADLADRASLDKLAEYLTGPGVFAGEMGLDRAAKRMDFELQRDVFYAQLELAARFRRPFMVHSVRAWAETITAIKKTAPGIKFLLHSFNGPVEVAQELEEMGAFFSVSVRQFQRPDEAFRQVFAALPSDRILIETDFPYQVKWTTPADYITSVKEAYSIAADWRGMEPVDFTEQIYANGALFTH